MGIPPPKARIFNFASMCSRKALALTGLCYQRHNWGHLRKQCLHNAVIEFWKPIIPQELCGKLSSLSLCATADIKYSLGRTNCWYQHMSENLSKLVCLTRTLLLLPEMRFISRKISQLLRLHLLAALDYLMQGDHKVLMSWMRCPPPGLTEEQMET